MTATAVEVQMPEVGTTVRLFTARDGKPEGESHGTAEVLGPAVTGIPLHIGIRYPQGWIATINHVSDLGGGATGWDY